MDIQPPRLIPPANPSLAKNLLQNLQVGQQLYAKVIEQLPEKNQVLLQIGQRLARATSDIALNNQQTLKLEVLQAKDQITLRILNAAPQAADTAALALRRLLPAQQPVAALHAQLLATQSLFDQPRPEANRLLSQIEQLTQRLIQLAPNRAQLSTPEGLKSAVRSSGIFLEPALIQHRFSTETVSVPVESRASWNPERPAGSSATGTLEPRASQPPRVAPSQTNRVITDSPLPGASTGSTARPPANDPLASRPAPASTTPQTPLAFESAPLSRIDTKANLLRLISLLKSWPGIQEPAMSQTPRADAQTPVSHPLPAASHPRPSGANPTPPPVLQQQLRELLSQSESALAKITIHQLASSNGDELARPQWQTEIPILHGGSQQSLLMRIEGEAEANRRDTEAAPWRVTLELNPPRLGMIRCQIELNQQQVNTEFWAENAQTNALIREHIADFRQQLQHAQLEANSIRCSSGPCPELKSPFAPAGVLNETA